MSYGSRRGRVPGRRSGCPAGIARAVAGVFALQVALAVDAAGQSEPPASTGRDRPPFAAILWRHGAGPYDADFHRRVAEAGFDGVSVTVGEPPRLPGADSLGCYLDQVAGKGVLELRDTQWQPVAEGFWQDRDPARLVRPTDLADPEVIAGMVRRVEESMTREGASAAWFASLADEPSATRHANPLDLCVSRPFVAGFRAWLRQRYRDDFAALVAVWGDPGAHGFESVLPWTTDRIRGRELRGVDLPENLAPWSDQLEFTDELFAAAVEAGLQAARSESPEMPIGLFGMQPPSAFGGHDYYRLLAGQTAFEAYDIGGARDLADCLADSRALRVVTLFPPGDAPLRLVDARLADALAHGADAVIVWAAGEVFGEDGAPTAFGRRFGNARRRLAGAARAFAGAELLRDPIWLVESQASIRAHWMLDSARDGRTWPRRLSSWEAEHSTSLAARSSWLRLFADLGFQPALVDSRELPARLAAGPPGLLVLPATLALDDDSLAAIRRYVEAGGRLLADHGTALYDERLRRREQGGLDDLFGLRGRSLRWTDRLVDNAGVVDGARLPGTGLGVAERGLRGGLGEPVGELGAVQLEARPRRGAATYLNLAVCEYAALRLDPARVAAARDLRTRVRWVLDDASLVPAVLARGKGLPTCLEVLRHRAPGGRLLLAVRVAALDAPELLRQLGEDGPRPLELRFAAPVQLLDVAAGRDLGTADTFELQIDPFLGVFLEVRAPQ